MASLKEIKGRIASVKSTQKITSAMKMVSSAKLHKAQSQIERFLPYQNRLTEILNSFLSSETEFTSPLAEAREVGAVAIVAVSSNSSMCGAFNSNVIKMTLERYREYRKALPDEKIHIYPVGKRMEDALRKEDLPVAGSYISLIDKPNFEAARDLADTLAESFLNKKIDKVELIYNHFKSTAVQVPTSEQFLPVLFSPSGKQAEASTSSIDYIVEPDKKTIIESLIPKSLRIKMYAVILDSAAAEQAARMLAMQIATDNAEDLLGELSIQFNKQRQQAITSELLDIIGGSEALK